MGVQTKNVSLVKTTNYNGSYHYANGTTYNQVVKQIIAAKFGKE